MEKTYIAIDLKSFYASVECVERNLNPLTTNLVVADVSRTQKTICLAVSPSLKAYGIPGRPRLFEVVQRIKEANTERKKKAPGRRFTGASVNAAELDRHPEYEISYITAVPRMQYYMNYSKKICDIYLKYVAPEDMHIYSVDEVFIDATAYLSACKMSPYEFAMTIIKDVLKHTGITATAGIGTNLFLCKVAMDIVAKKKSADKDGVRIAELNERSFRVLLWNHRPLTDFWRIGQGYAQKLENNGLYTMGDIARCSIGTAQEYYNEDLLYRLFGINAELLIDHAWGWEPTTIAEIKSYRPDVSSLSSGQVLQEPYTADKARLIVKEMTDLLVLDLVDKHFVTDQMVLTIGYDIDNLRNSEIRKKYKGEITTDHYGRQIPKHAHGTVNLKEQTSSTKMILDAVMQLYDRIVNPNLLVRRVNVAACRIIPEKEKNDRTFYEQMDLFTDYDILEKEKEQKERALAKEKKIQHAILDIHKKYGKNALLKGMNLEEGAMTIQRNGQIGGHKA